MKINKLNESACWFGKYFDKDNNKKLVYISKELTGDADEADKMIQDMIPEPFTKFVFCGSVDSKMAESEGMTLLEKKLTESADDEFFDIQDVISAALNSIGGDMDDVTGGITSSYDEDRLLLSLYSTVDRKDARKFKKNFLTTIEGALSQTRFSEVSHDENHTYAYQLSRNDIFNMLGSDRAEEFMSKFAMFEICITAYGKKLEEAMTIAYSEDTIKRMISQLKKEIEDYKQLIIDEPEDKSYWEEEIKKCEDEISDLESYKPLNENDKQEILYIIRDSKGNQLSAPNPDDEALWDRVASMEARGRRGLCVVVYTGKKVNESTKSLGEEDFIEVDDPSVVDKLDYAGAVEVRGNKVYADANTLRQLKNDMDNLTEAKVFGAKGKKLNEASYGGAYDIADDQYFTKEEVVQFGEEVIDTINTIGYSKVSFVSAYVENGNIEVTAEFDGAEATVSTRIDMRRIRKPSDLYRAYGKIIADKLIRELSDIGADMGPHISDQDYPMNEDKNILPVQELNQDGTPKQYDVKFMDLERLPGKLNWDVADQLQDHFRKNNLWVDELHYNQTNDRIEFDINWGDWKHEHLRAKWLLQELFDSLGIKAEIRSHTTEEDGTDTYSAHYVVYSIG